MQQASLLRTLLLFSVSQDAAGAPSVLAMFQSLGMAKRNFFQPGLTAFLEACYNTENTSANISLARI